MRESMETIIRNMILENGWFEGDYDTARKIVDAVNIELLFRMSTIKKCSPHCDGFDEITKLIQL
jgi:hypothetical protein